MVLIVKVVSKTSPRASMIESSLGYKYLHIDGGIMFDCNVVDDVGR